MQDCVLPRRDGMAWGRRLAACPCLTKRCVHHEGCFCSRGCHSSADAPCRRCQHVSSQHIACRYATNAVVPVDESDSLIPTASGLVSARCLSGAWWATAAAPACSYPLSKGLLYPPSLAIASES